MARQVCLPRSAAHGTRRDDDFLLPQSRVRARVHQAAVWHHECHLRKRPTTDHRLVGARKICHLPGLQGCAEVFRWMSSNLALGEKAKGSLPEADQSALSKARLIQSRRESSSTGFSPARGRARCKNTWTCTARFPPTRAVSISRKKISRPKAGLSRGENISMSHGPNGRAWSRFSSWSKKSRPAGTRNR